MPDHDKHAGGQVDAEDEGSWGPALSCYTYPAHHDKHAGGQVDAEDEGTQGPGQDDLQTKHAVVACK